MSAPRHAALDAFRIEILSNALNAITEEIQLTLLRSAYSQVVKEAQDASCAIFTAEGRMVAQPVVVPGHLGSMRFMLQAVLQEFPAETVKPGDVFMNNDPYRGGSHLPDISVFRPVFHEGKLVAFTGCMIHYTDVGGMVPGSNPVKATELYQEGLIIPPVKLYDCGQPNKTMFDMISANVRNPDIFMGDLRAQEGALMKGEERLRDLLARYGADGVARAMDMLIDFSEKKAREAIRAIPNGVFEFTDYMDHDGVDLSKPVAIKVRLEVRDDSFFFDFTGSDPQVKGPLNAPLSKAWTTVFYCVRCVLPDDIPFNDGLTRVVEVFARRLQTQETMTAQITDAIDDALKPRGIAVLIEAEHMCMSMRGVQKQGASTITTRFTGVFRDDPAEQARFYQMVRGFR